MPSTTRRLTRSSAAVAVGILVALSFVAGACGDDGGGDQAATTTTALVTPQDYSGRGPFHVGALELQLDDKHKLEVFYPVDEVPTSSTAYGYSGGELFGEKVAALLPGAFRDPIEPTDTWVDAPASAKGPFPVVLFSHGFASWYKFSSLHNAHVASYGYVVMAVDHPERGLLTSLSGPQDDSTFDADTDVDQLFTALDRVTSEGQTAGSVLEGVVDPSRVAAEGHSAGGRASGAAAYDERIDAWIGLAPGAPVRSETYGGTFDDFDFASWSAENDPPPVPSMILEGKDDGVVPLDGVEAVYAWLDAPKRLVVLKNAGHNAFTDLCEPIQAEGGLRTAIEALGFDPDNVAVVRLGEDGCTADNIPAQQGYDAINHLVVAQLDWVFDIEPAVAQASLQPGYLERTFPDTIASVKAEN